MPGLISLAGGYPAPELFPVDAFREAFDAVLSTDAGAALQYGTAEGYLPLREFLAGRMARFGIRASPEEVMITHGSQQGLDLVARLFVDWGSPVAVEDPSYVGGLQAFDGYGARYLAIPTDEDGMQVDWLEEALARGEVRPRLIYALSNFQNPSGATLSLERRHRLLELSYRHHIPILEDDPYGELRYEGKDLPSLKSLDVEGNVIYLGTFSKILAPGLRLGWVVAPTGVIRGLLLGKEAADLHTNSLAQRAVHELCRRGLLDRHIPRIRSVYRGRRDAMLRALAAHLPDGARWSRPKGGLFLWVQLPGGVDTDAMLPDAVREKVVYVPGSAFSPRRERTSAMRLNFSNCPPAEIEEGVRRLGMVAGRWSERAAATRPRTAEMSSTKPTPRTAPAAPLSLERGRW